MNNELIDIAEQFLKVFQEIRNEIGNNKFGIQQEFTDIQWQQMQLKDEIQIMKNGFEQLKNDIYDLKNELFDLNGRYYDNIK